MVRVVRSPDKSRAIRETEQRIGETLEGYFERRLANSRPPNQREMAEELQVSLPTVNSWLRRYGWVAVTTVKYARKRRAA